MEEYLKKYPSDRNDILTLAFSYTQEEGDKIFKKALKENKRIVLLTSKTKLDYIDYKFV